MGKSVRAIMTRNNRQLRVSGDICTVNARNMIHVAADEGRGEFNGGDDDTALTNGKDHANHRVP